MAAVDVESLTVTYGDVTAVDDLSFRAEAGEVTCVLGPNGAGKTSTVEALEGLRRPTSGRLSVIGLDPRADHRALTERIGVMLQEGGMHPAVRVREALRHAAALYRNPVDPHALLDRLGLSGLERRTYRQLSGGEQRRLALALALVGRPQVAFLDEPTTGVDPAGRRVIRQVIADLRREGVTVLLTTHDLDEAERIADRVVIVDEGRLVAAGTVAELTRSSGADEHVRFRAPAGLDRASLAAHLGGAAVVETAPGDYTVAGAPTPQTVAAITAWLADHDLPLADLRAGRQRLEDIYLRLTAAGASSPTREPADAAEAAHAGEPDVSPDESTPAETTATAGGPTHAAEPDTPPDERALAEHTVAVEAEPAEPTDEGMRSDDADGAATTVEPVVSGATRDEPHNDTTNAPHSDEAYADGSDDGPRTDDGGGAATHERPVAPDDGHEPGRDHGVDR
jgi:ABC-2 type transport system ATP-binding protein